MEWARAVNVEGIGVLIHQIFKSVASAYLPSPQTPATFAQFESKVFMEN